MCEHSESSQERRIALFKSNQQQQQHKERENLNHVRLQRLQLIRSVLSPDMDHSRPRLGLGRLWHFYCQCNRGLISVEVLFVSISVLKPWDSTIVSCEGVAWATVYPLLYMLSLMQHQCVYLLLVSFSFLPDYNGCTCNYAKGFEMCISLWLNLIVLRWPWVVDRTLTSDY